MHKVKGLLFPKISNRRLKKEAFGHTVYVLTTDIHVKIIAFSSNKRIFSSILQEFLHPNDDYDGERHPRFCNRCFKSNVVSL